MEEAGDSVSASLHSLAGSSTGHSEECFHKVVSDYGLALEIPLTMVTVDGFGSFPVLLMSDWLQFILKLS